VTNQPRVVIIGGGFGGLCAARGLAGAPFSVTLIDKRNYHLFRPMLYQVATGLLSADQALVRINPADSISTSTLACRLRIDRSGRARVMRDHRNCFAKLPIEFCQQVQDFFRRFSV
jgi:NADH dehydrogenase FAD-containing subunit